MKLGLAIALATITTAANVTAAYPQSVEAPNPPQTGTIYQTSDKFDGSVVYNTERRDVALEGGSFWSSRFVNFQFVAARPVPNPEFPYALVVHTQTPDWIFIESGSSLLLKLDGSEMMQLAGNGSSNARRVSTGANVLEAAYYALTPDMLRKIASAKSVEFRIIGDKQTITGTWSADLISDAAIFSEQGPQLLGFSATSQASIPTSGAPQPAMFGVGYVAVPAQLAAMMKLPPSQGVLVVKVMPGSVASRAGIMAGDVILSFGSASIARPEELQALVANVPKGQRISVTIWRGTSQTALDAQF
jgi:hypothetical protein